MDTIAITMAEQLTTTSYCFHTQVSYNWLQFRRTLLQPRTAGGILLTTMMVCGTVLAVYINEDSQVYRIDG